jgi:hypothetical protein
MFRGRGERIEGRPPEHAADRLIVARLGAEERGF